MFFDDAGEIAQIARKAGTSVFVVPKETEVEIPGAIVLQPEDKATITIEQVRGVQANVQKKQTGEIMVMIRPAELMTEAAANAMLKTLEQPGENVHFVLIAERASDLLPTILSRAAVYFLRPRADALETVGGDEDLKKLARKLLKGVDLVATATEVVKAKSGFKRQKSLGVLGIAIEMAYKSYFKTRNAAFLQRIPGLLKAYENIQDGGNAKLQIVANLC